MWAKVLPIVIANSVLVRSILMHLLGAVAKLLRSRVAVRPHVAHFETSLVLTSRGAVSSVV